MSSAPAPNRNVPKTPLPLADLNSLTAVVRALKQGMDSLGGWTGDPIDRAVTFRDLVGLKLVSQAAAASPTGTTTVGGTLVNPYVLSGFTGSGAMQPGLVLFGHQFPVQVTFPANFGPIAIAMASECGSFVPAAGAAVFNLQRCVAVNDPTLGGSWTTIGTASFAATGHAAVLATTGGVDVVFAANDYFRCQGPASSDPTLAQMFMALVGRR